MTTLLFGRSNPLRRRRLVSSIVPPPLSPLNVKLNSWYRHFSQADDDNGNGNGNVSFGFRNVKKGEKSQLVNEVFKKVATKYDLMNDVMTGGVHRGWKDHFTTSYVSPKRGMRVLDVAGGTGDIAFRLLSNANKRGIFDYKVTLLDINQDMLNVGRERAKQRGLLKGLEWIVGDAENLPLEGESFEVYTIAFGIRNCTNIDKVLREAFRVLKPGGHFLCLELSPDAFNDRPLLRLLYDKYSFEVIPILGQIFAADRLSYQYLVESIRKFPGQKDFTRMIETAGFERISGESLFGGIALISSAWKPITTTSSSIYLNKNGV